MKAAVRVYSLTLGGAGPRTIEAMENHGKRLDKSSKARRVRDVDPLIFGSLDLRAEYDKHVKGARQNAGLKRPVLHAVVQFPKHLGRNEKEQKLMLDLAVKWVNLTHGGNAVFAARLDRDEAGTATVDVFFSPKYQKVTKAGAELWISTSKHGKELCQKHRAEIERRHDGKFSTGPRQVGIALQADWYEYLASIGLKLEPRTEKLNSRPDRDDPETYKAREDAKRASLEAQERLERMKRKEGLLDAERESVAAEKAAIAIDRKKIQAARSNLWKAVEALEGVFGLKLGRKFSVVMEKIRGLLRTPDTSLEAAMEDSMRKNAGVYRRLAAETLEPSRNDDDSLSM